MISFYFRYNLSFLGITLPLSMKWFLHFLNSGHLDVHLSKLSSIKNCMFVILGCFTYVYDRCKDLVGTVTSPKTSGSNNNEEEVYNALENKKHHNPELYREHKIIVCNLVKKINAYTRNEQTLYAQVHIYIYIFKFYKFSHWYCVCCL